MAFTDLFDRIDAANLGPDWEEWNTNHVISGNKAVPESNSACGSFSAVDMATDDHFAEVEIGGFPSGSSFFGPIVRAPAPGTASTNTGMYYILMVSGTSFNTVTIRRKANNSSSLTLLDSMTQVINLNDRLRIEAEGDTIRALVNDVEVLSVVDTAVPAGQRRVGIYSDMPSNGPGAFGYTRFDSDDLNAGPSSQTINVTGLSDTESFGTASVVAGSKSIPVTGFGDTESFGTPVITGSIAVPVTGFADPVAFGAAAVSAGSAVIPATGMTASVVFGSPGVSAGAKAINTTGIADPVVFGSASIASGQGVIQIIGIADSEIFGTVLIAAGPKAIDASGLSSPTQFGAASIMAAPMSIPVDGFPSIEAFGVPIVIAGSYALAAAGFTESIFFGTPSVTNGIIQSVWSYWDGVQEIPAQAFYWDGVNEVPIQAVEIVG